MKIIEAFSVCTDCMLEIETAVVHHEDKERIRNLERFCRTHQYLSLHRNTGKNDFEGPGHLLMQDCDESGSLGFFCGAACEACGSIFHGERHCMVELGVFWEAT